MSEEFGGNVHNSVKQSVERRRALELLVGKVVELIDDLADARRRRAGSRVSLSRPRPCTMRTPAQLETGASATFRAELMPGRDRTQRTFKIERILPSCRVLIEGLTGEHALTEFESVR